MSFIPWRCKQPQGKKPESSPLAALRSEMDRLFESYLREPLGAIDWPFGGAGSWSPTIDVAEDDEEITVRAELPGIDPQDLDVTVSADQLVLTGEKKELTENEGKDFFHSESRYGSFRRRVRLPQQIDTENVDAQYANGVLTLRLKKTQPVKPQRIEIKVRQ